MDCHRTWEAMALGCIPIVNTSPLDPFYKQLPVMIVDDWSTLTMERMKAFANSVSECPSKHPMLKLDHWRQLLREYTNE